MGGFEVSLLLKVMSRRQVNPARHYAACGTSRYMSSVRYRSRSSHLLSIMLVTVAAIFYLGYFYHVSDGRRSNIGTGNKVDGRVSCTSEVQRAIPVLKKVYGDSMNKVLFVGPYTCSVVPELFKQVDTEAWGVEPYGLDDMDSYCRTLVQKGIVRVADIKFPLPYRVESFSHVIVSDALEYLSSRFLNSTLPDLMRVSSDGVIIFARYPGHPGHPAFEFPRYGRPAKVRSPSWWKRYFVQMEMEENDAAQTKFKQASMESSYKPACQVLHLKSGAYL